MDSLRSLIREYASSADIEYGPPPSRLKRETLRYGKLTVTGALSVVSKKAKARDPKATFILDESPERDMLLDRASELLSEVEPLKLYAIERCIGAGRRVFRLLALVERTYPHLALMAYRNFFPCEYDGEPDFITLDVPGTSGKLILVEKKTGATLILGSDYYGELKMSFLRQTMNYSRDESCEPGLHAGSKLYKVKKDGLLKEVGVLIFGLSGTGKTTLTVETHGLKPPEGAILRQDDIVILTRSGEAVGTEFNLYPKTDSIPELPLLKPSVEHPDAILENVVVREDGQPDFSDLSITPNARALAIRDAIPIADGRYDLDHVDLMVFLTRRPEMPPLVRLTSPEQAAAYFALGESYRTSAEAGRPEPVRVPGFDPFMLEPRWRTVVLIMDIVRRKEIEVVVMNTGYVGDAKVPPEASKNLLLATVKGEVDWRFDDELGVEVAVKAPGVDLEVYNPRRIYGPSAYSEAVRRLREERRRFIVETIPQLRFLADYV
ncbi:MAG: phosphoenolpyruvate carboxykinase [Desulfurococcales archaeon]|nr:phosphoenolpyruvate carboxykinase [Desulfurococcales archaeon]